MKTRLNRNMRDLLRRAGSIALLAAMSAFLAGCGEKPKAGPAGQGPVEGRKFVSGEKAATPAARPEKDVAVAKAPVEVPAASTVKDFAATPASGEPKAASGEPKPASGEPAAPTVDPRKKRDDWRDAKLAGENPGTGYTGATPVKVQPGTVPPAPPAASVPQASPAATSPVAPASPTAPTAPATPAAAATDSPAPFVDPNNPNFVPADRKVADKFDIKSLKEIDGHLDLPFGVISGYEFAGTVGATVVKDSKNEKRSIPDAIKQLNDKKVVITGYMMPIDFEDGGTNEFVLTRVIPSCFYCQPPQLNDWVEVKIKDGKRVPYIPDGPVTAYGTLKVGEVVEDGFVVALYRMTAIKAPAAPQN